MKNKSHLFILAAIVITGFVSASLTFEDIQQMPVFPEEVGKVLKNSCFNCHSGNAKNEDSKAALNLDIWIDYKVTKKISLLSDIDEVLKEGAMPPGKFLERNPDKALTDEQVKLIRDWTKKETEKLMK